MHTLADADLTARTLSLTLSLASIEDLALDPSLDDAAVSLRLAQYELCALGQPCPELAFDPVASRLRAAVAPLRTRGVGGGSWARWSSQCGAFFGAVRAARRGATVDFEARRTELAGVLAEGAANAREGVCARAKGQRTVRA